MPRTNHMIMNNELKQPKMINIFSDIEDPDAYDRVHGSCFDDSDEEIYDIPYDEE